MLRWLFLGIVAAVIIAWLGAQIHLFGRPVLGITSLGVGLLLGAILGALAIKLQIPNSSRVVVATLIIALIAMSAQHAWLYRDFRRQWHEARAHSPQVAMFRPAEPWTPREYFLNEIAPSRVALWCADAVLIAIGAVGGMLAVKRFAHGAEELRDAKANDTNSG